MGAVVIALLPVLCAMLLDVSAATIILVTVVACAASAVALATWALVRTRRYRREFEAHLEQWAGDQAVARERLRIAGDLHDLISHSLGLITLRAAAGRITDAEGTDAGAALRDIESMSREATTELRRMLGVLRSDSAAPAPLAPADSIDTLADIAQAARDAGLTVNLSMAEIGQLPASAQVTICAVVREALTNAARHAGPTTVTVGIGRGPESSLEVNVVDAGPVKDWQPRRGTGQGLAGLRERVASHGGTLACTNIEGGFHVRAVIPRDDLP